MAKGRKTGDTTSGTPHRKTQAVTDRLETLGRDPIEDIARLAMDETVEPSIQAEMYKEPP
jgi:hypothetical protein